VTIIQLPYDMSINTGLIRFLMKAKSILFFLASEYNVNLNLTRTFTTLQTQTFKKTVSLQS